jgi:hypothetical protein
MICEPAPAIIDSEGAFARIFISALYGPGREQVISNPTSWGCLFRTAFLLTQLISLNMHQQLVYLGAIRRNATLPCHD